MEIEREPDGSLELVRRYLEHAPVASAVVSGAAHVIVVANAAFRYLSQSAEAGAAPDVPLADTLPRGAQAGVLALLDRVRRDGIAVRNARVRAPGGRGGPRSRAAWCCDVWPVIAGAGRLDYLVVAIRASRRSDLGRVHQRTIAERLLLTALREQDQARLADTSRARAVFLADASRRLGASFELDAAFAAVAQVALPTPGAWCVVDVVQPNGSWHRLPIVHPDPLKARLVRELDGHWSPAPGDPLGIPLMSQSRTTTIVDADRADVLSTAAHGTANLRILGSLGLGSLLVVPLVAHDRLGGAITFVSPPGAAPYGVDDIQLAEDLAERCATLLDGAHLYDSARVARSEALAAGALADLAREEADTANRAKSAFLTSMSHELRTPLNAILGYTELVLIGLRGVVSPEQEDALRRIQRAGTHLLGLINDVLNMAKLKAAQVRVTMSDIAAADVLDSAGSMVEPQAEAKGLAFVCMASDPGLTIYGDREKVIQILLNVLSNAIKFTASGGRVTLAATAFDRRRRSTGTLPQSEPVAPRSVQLTVVDTGRGLAAGQLTAIFDPFVQVGRPLTGVDAGIGLGLAISRDLARAMGGDLTVESTLGVGSTFTLTMPSAAPV
jgi:signal transduction histidine kinase